MNVMKFYKSVIDDVINNVKEVFIDEGIDENVLMDLRHAWETKLAASQAVVNDQQTFVGLPIAHGRGAAASQLPGMAQGDNATTNSRSTAQHRNARHVDNKVLPQLDGIDRGSSSEEEVEDDEDDDDDLIATGVKDEPDDEEEADDVPGVDVDAAAGDADNEANATNGDANGEGNEEEPLNSDDDVSDDDPEELTETENVIMCQYDRISRTRNRWKFTLRDGIMNVNGRDFVFSKALGDAEW